MPTGISARYQCRSRRVASGSPVTSAPCSRRSLKKWAAPTTSSIASVASRNGAPMIAPIAICSPSSLSSPSSATIGITDSGSAVPTAASSAPTAPAPRFIRCPSHSTAFVKPIAPPMMRTKAPSSSRTVIMRIRAPRCGGVALSDHGSPRRRRARPDRAPPPEAARRPRPPRPRHDPQPRPRRRPRGGGRRPGPVRPRERRPAPARRLGPGDRVRRGRRAGERTGAQEDRRPRRRREADRGRAASSASPAT